MLADPVTARPEIIAPDPHGQSALLLVESLIHTRVGNRVISLPDAVNTMVIAIDAQVDMTEAGRSSVAATSLLEAIRRSLEADLLHSAND